MQLKTQIPQELYTLNNQEFTVYKCMSAVTISNLTKKKYDLLYFQQLFHHVPSTESRERPSISSQSSSQQNIGSVSNINEEKEHDNISQKSSASLFNFADHFDDVQRTVISIGQISVDTQDSRIYQDAPFAGGNLKFGSKSPEEKIEVALNTEEGEEGVGLFIIIITGT